MNSRVLIVALILPALLSAEPSDSTIENESIQVALSSGPTSLHLKNLINRQTHFDWAVPDSPVGPNFLFAADFVWKDQSPHANHALLTAGDSGLAMASFGSGDRPVMRFNGDDYFTLTNSEKLRLPRFSVHAVMQVTGKTGSQCFFSNYHNPINWGKGINLGIDPGRNVYFFTTAGTQESYSPMVSSVPVSDGFHVITCTYDENEKRIYVDGADVGREKSKGLDYHPGTVAAIGALREFHQWFRGNLAELVVFDSVDAKRQASIEATLGKKYGIAVPSRESADPTTDLGKPVLWLKADVDAEPESASSEIAGIGTSNQLHRRENIRRKTAKGGDEVLTRWLRSDGLALEWSMNGIPELPVVECRASLWNTAAKQFPNLKQFGPLSLKLRGDAKTLKLHWVNRDGYEKREETLDDFFFITGGAWNAPNSAGWLAIEDVERQEILFFGVEWESYWKIEVERQGSHVNFHCFLERFSRDLAPEDELVAPRIFFGVTHGDIDDSLRDLHDYLRRHVISPVPADFPWVTYNTWGTETGGVDEALAVAEIPFAKELGAELFYIDASWYQGSCKVKGLGDWFTGLGNWHEEDFEKYPHGLAYLSHKVRAAGMKFGLWFAPQMVDSNLIGKRIPELWAARHQGADLVTNVSPEWGQITQICLGNREVVEFLKRSLEHAVIRYGLDWIKWDGSGLPGRACDRGDHGHQEGDGPLAALRGQYEIWEYLHSRFPDLSLEQCGYPCRIDYGLARYMRTNWLSDASSDPAGVRKNVINASYVYPACHLETWVYKTKEINEEKDPALLDTVIRSRMVGLFGFGARFFSHHDVVSTYPPEAIEASRRNVKDFKRYRHLLREDVYHVLPPNKDPKKWDGIEYCKRDGSEAVVLAFRGKSDEESKVFKLRGLKDNSTYAVISFNDDTTQHVSGASLRSDGLKITLPRKEMSEIVLISDVGHPVETLFHGEIEGVEAVVASQPAQIRSLAEEETPKDIDLKGMARWALNYLIHNPREHLDYECRFNVFPLYCPPTILGHDPVTFGDTDVRMDWEFIYMRDICGVTAGRDVQAGVRKRILDYVDDRNLIAFPYGKGEVGFEAFKKLGPDKSIPFSVGGAKVPSFWSTGKTMVGLAETYLRTGDKEALANARKMFVALRDMAHWKDGMASYDAKEIIGGILVEVFVRYWEITRDPEAMKLAVAFADWILKHGGIGADGSHGGHSHTTMHMVWGVAHLGLVTGDDRYTEWAKRVFDFMRTRGTDFGWIPAAFGDPNVLHFSETCATSDMVSIACCVAEAAHPEYWGHAERFVRNYIREIQFFITPEYIAQYHKLNKDKPEEVKKGIEMMRELEGGFLGTMAPNDQTSWHESHFGGGPDYMLLWGCCSPEGMRTLHTVWRKIVTETDEGVFVNMHFSRETPQAKVVSFLPHTGRLTVQARTDDDFLLRPPTWALRESVKAYRNGKEIEVDWAGPSKAYVRFSGATDQDELTITYPLTKFRQKIIIGDETIPRPYTLEWLGNTVMSISPKGPNVPMFHNVPRPLPNYEPLYATENE